MTTRDINRFTIINIDAISSTKQSFFNQAVLLRIKHHDMKMYRTVGGIAPLIPGFGTRCR
jgi:hypothetical protein